MQKQVRWLNDLEIHVWGDGVPAVLVHGSINTGDECWEGQRSLTDQGFRLLVPNRRGYGGSAAVAGEDFLVDAADVAALLGEGAHLVGQSYGGIAALLAAAQRPGAVRSLAVVEPPAFGLAAQHPAVADLVRRLTELIGRHDLDDGTFLERFLTEVGAPVEEIPEELLDHWSDQVWAMRQGRFPDAAEIPVSALRQAPFPKLVVSGGHHPAFDAVCGELEREIGADRVEITGAGHEVQMMAEPFNAALSDLWSRRPSARPFAHAGHHEPTAQKGPLHRS